MLPPEDLFTARSTGWLLAQWSLFAVTSQRTADILLCMAFLHV